jgi:hypothetical protein
MDNSELINEMEEKGIKGYAEMLRKWGKGYDEIALNISTIKGYPVKVEVLEEAFLTWNNPYPKRYQRTLKKVYHKKPGKKMGRGKKSDNLRMEDEFLFLDGMRADIVDSLNHGYTIKQISDRIKRMTNRSSKNLEEYIKEKLKIKPYSGLHDSDDYFESKFNEIK